MGYSLAVLAEDEHGHVAVLGQEQGGGGLGASLVNPASGATVTASSTKTVAMGWTVTSQLRAYMQKRLQGSGAFDMQVRPFSWCAYAPRDGFWGYFS